MRTEGSWVPAGCTLPTEEQPMRVAEFDALFADAVIAVERVDTARLRLGLRPEAAGRAAELAVRETGCCSFFRFALTVDDGRVLLDVSVPASHLGVLDAIRARIDAAVRGRPTS